jgi:anti-repressor protein
MRERILQFIEYSGLNKNKFYSIVGLSNGFLDKKGSVGTDKLEKIIKAFPEINLVWLVLGEGNMLKAEDFSEDTITISDSDGIKTVSARDLYRYLCIKTDFTEWCKRMFEYGFEDGKDFTPILGKSTGGRPSVDYALTIDTAKEISMIQRSEKGKKAREYFLDCEKKLQTMQVTPTKTEVAPIVTDFDIPKTKGEALLLAANQQLQLEQKDEQLVRQDEQIKKLEPRSVYFDKMIKADDLLSMQEVAKLLNVEGMGRTKLYEKLREGGIIMKYCTSPYQQYVSRGYFELKEELIKLNDNMSKVNVRTFVTQKGLAFIFKFFGLEQTKSA